MLVNPPVTRGNLLFFSSGGEEEEERQEAGGQPGQGEQDDAAYGFQGRRGQDQAAEAADRQGARPGPAPAAVPVLRRAQASTAPEGARIPEANSNRAVKCFSTFG